LDVDAKNVYWVKSGHWGKQGPHERGEVGSAHQEKSLFNSSVRATFPARLADAMVLK
jgi:hypothetical protein